MKTGSPHPKIRTDHLARKALVYLRQSSLRQVRENQESQRLQYGLAERASQLGFQEVEVIDSDLGCSASIGAAQRAGFERVISSVAMGEVGLLLSREVSRLSRTDKDWCHLLEVCQIFGTLIGDEEQIYDLSLIDDQLVLGIKGTLSVVELKVLRLRMEQGRKRRRAVVSFFIAWLVAMYSMPPAKSQRIPISAFRKLLLQYSKNSGRLGAFAKLSNGFATTKSSCLSTINISRAKCVRFGSFPLCRLSKT